MQKKEQSVVSSANISGNKIKRFLKFASGIEIQNNSIKASLFLHTIIAVLFFVSLPSFLEKLPEENQVISFEMLPMSSISNVKNQAKQKKSDKKSILKKAQKMKASANKKKSTPKKNIAKKNKVSKKNAQPKLVNKKTLKKIATKAPAKSKNKKIKLAKEKPSKKSKKLAKKNEDSIDTILRNLDNSSDGKSAKSRRKIKNSDLEEKQFAKSDKFYENNPLSISELHLIRSQIERNWNVQRFLGISKISEIQIKTNFKLSKNGKVLDIKIINIYCPPNMDGICKNISQSVVQAIWNTSPVKNLISSRYDIWKEIEVIFSPTDL